MGQSKLMSALESWANLLSGFVISFLVWQFIAAPLYGYEVTFMDNMGLTSIFTVVSLIRSYTWRRYFNRLFIRSNGNGF